MLIDYVAERFTRQQLQQMDPIADNLLIISVITRIEVMGFNGDAIEMAKMAAFIQVATVIPLSEAIVL